MLLHVSELLLDFLTSCLWADSAQEQRIDQYDNPEQELPRTVYRTEVDRIKYLLRSYLRTRLKKVERYCLFILDNEEAQQMLSPKEMQYAKVGNNALCSKRLTICVRKGLLYQ